MKKFLSHSILFSAILFSLIACKTVKTVIKEPTETIIKEDPWSHLDSKQKEVQKSLAQYLKALENLNPERIMELTYPKLFLATSRSRFRDYLYTIISSTNLNIKSFKSKITKINKIESFSNGIFCPVTYHSEITITFLNPDAYNDEYSIRVLQNILGDKYGRNRISTNHKDRSITIKKYEKLLAIKEQGETWKFVGYNKEYKKLYPSFLPSDILNKI